MRTYDGLYLYSSFVRYSVLMEWEESILLKSLYYPKQSRVGAIPIKIPMAIFTEIEQF